MKVKYLGESSKLALLNGKIYEVVAIEPTTKKLYAIIDETGE